MLQQRYEHSTRVCRIKSETRNELRLRNDLTWYRKAISVIGYVSGTQQCAFEILPDVRCTGNTVERKVKTVACTETWETDTVCTNQQQCVSGECKPIISCQDPDGKEGYDTATTTTGPTDSAKLTVSETKADSCASTALLTEYYCDGGTTGIIKSATKSCNCINGACVKLSCTETDTGKDTTKTGTTTGPLTKYDTTPTTKTDTCSGSTLTEYYCDTTTRLIASTTAIEFMQKRSNRYTASVHGPDGNNPRHERNSQRLLGQ